MKRKAEPMETTNPKRSRVPASVDLLERAAGYGYTFQVHNQEMEETCVAHAATSMHELIIKKHLRVEDLTLDWMNDIGALMVDVAKFLSQKGQQESTENSKDTCEKSSARPARRCQTAHRLNCSQLQANVMKCKFALRKGNPFVLMTKEFSRKISKMTVANRKKDKSSMGSQLHAVCVYGYEDGASEEGGGNFLLLNSHGVEWGDEGKGKISYKFFEKYTHQVWGIA